MILFYFDYSYYGPGTSLFYPMAPAAAGIPLTAGTAFAAGAPNGGVPTMSQAAMAGGAGLHAHNFAAAAAAAAAAQQQQQQQQQQQSAVLGTNPFALATSLKPGTNTVSPSSTSVISSTIGTSSSPVSTTTIATKTGSPAAKKFRPAFARPSHKSSRYIPKPIPQELGNLKTYSKQKISIYTYLGRGVHL